MSAGAMIESDGDGAGGQARHCWHSPNHNESTTRHLVLNSAEIWRPLTTTILRVGPYRFYFYSYDCSEPRHTHSDRENCSAKFRLDPDERASQITIWPENCAASSASCARTPGVHWKMNGWILLTRTPSKSALRQDGHMPIHQWRTRKDIWARKGQHVRSGLRRSRLSIDAGTFDGLDSVGVTCASRADYARTSWSEEWAPSHEKVTPTEWSAARLLLFLSTGHSYGVRTCPRRFYKHVTPTEWSAANGRPFYRHVTPRAEWTWFRTWFRLARDQRRW